MIANIENSTKEAYEESTTQIDKIIVDNQEYFIEVELLDDCYNEGNIFGTTICKEIDFEIDNSIELENKEVEYFTGIYVNNEIKWIKIGNFIVVDVQPNDTTDTNKVVAYDYMFKASTLYETKLNYTGEEITMKDVLQEACNNCGLQIGNIEELPNKNFVVDSNQFEENALNIQVIQAGAQMNACFAKVRNDNKLYFINPNKNIAICKVFDLSSYEEAEIKRKTHPINHVSLGMTNIEGENIDLRDDESILINGENSLVINDNPFAYTQEKRKQLITAIFNAVKGFEYTAFSLKGTQGRPYLETGDKVQIKDMEGNLYNSFIFRYNFKSPNGLESEIEAPSIIKATVQYQNVPSLLDRMKYTEYRVNKAEGMITSVVSEVEGQNQKISKIEQTSDGIVETVNKIVDLTKTVSGAKQVVLEGATQNTLAGLEIEGNNQAFSKDTYIRVISQENLRDNFEKIITNHNISINALRANQQASCYYAYTSIVNTDSVFYMCKINTNKKYRIKFNDVQEDDRIYIGVFYNYPFSEESIYTAYNQAYSNRYSRFNSETNEWEWYGTTQNEFFIEPNPITNETQYLIIWVNRQVLFLTSEISEYIQKELIKTDYSPPQYSSYYLSYVDKDTHEFTYSEGAKRRSHRIEVEPNIIYKVTKEIPINIFSLATFSQSPDWGDVATQYVSTDNEGLGVSELEIITGEDDKYLVITFFDEEFRELSTNDQETRVIISNMKIKKEIVGTLEQYEGIHDSYLLSEGIKSQIIKRIGYDEEGNKYILPNENILNYEDVDIPVFGKNDILQLVSDTAILKATYIVENLLEGKFATVTQLMAQIKILADQIALTVKQDDIIAQLNVAIREGKSIIEILGNILKIQTDNFELSEDGTTIIKKGTIASFRIGDMVLETDLVGIAGGEQKAFWVKQTKDGQPIAYITMDGQVYCKQIWIDGFAPVLSTQTPGSTAASIVKRLRHNFDSTGPYLEYTTVNGTAYGCRAFQSDKRLKKNIKESNVKALPLLRKIIHKSFEWKNKKGKIELGYIADELQKINKNFVFEVGEKKIKQISEVALIPYLSKGIQELDEENQGLRKRIKKLEDMIGEK